MNLKPTLLRQTLLAPTQVVIRTESTGGETPPTPPVPIQTDTNMYNGMTILYNGVPILYN